MTPQNSKNIETNILEKHNSDTGLIKVLADNIINETNEDNNENDDNNNIINDSDIKNDEK